MKALKNLHMLLILFDGQKISYMNLNKPDAFFNHFNLDNLDEKYLEDDEDLLLKEKDDEPIQYINDEED